MSPALEVAPGYHDDIARSPRSPEDLVGQAAPPLLRRSGVGDDHEQVVVAIGAAVAAGARPK